LSLPLRPGSLAQFAPVSETWLVGWVVARAVMGMDGQPDIVSFEPRPRRPDWWPKAGRGGRIAIVVVLLACLAVIASLALLVANRDHTIADLRTALRNSRHQAPATAAGPALPADSGSAMFTLPDAALGSFSVVAVAVRAGPGSAPVTWLFVYGQHAAPGQRYGLLEGTCGGQYVTASDLADGTADRRGDLTITARELAISPQAPDFWVMLYRWEDGAPLGGVQGPLAGSGAKTFRSGPPC